MAKSTGGTRSGSSSNPSGNGTAARVYMRNLRLSDIMANLTSGRVIGRYQMFVQMREVGGVNMYVPGFTRTGTGTFTTTDETFTNQNLAMQAAERLVQERIKEENSPLSPSLKALAERIVNDKERDGDMDESRVNEFFYNYGGNVVDITRYGKRVGRGVRENGKYKITWF